MSPRWQAFWRGYFSAFSLFPPEREPFRVRLARRMERLPTHEEQMRQDAAAIHSDFEKVLGRNAKQENGCEDH